MNHSIHGPVGGDTDIIDLYFARDERAITETDRRYGRACMQLSYNILENRPDAEECVSDTYLKTWNAIPPTRPQSLCAFVLRIVRNLSLDRLRRRTAARRDRGLTVSLSELEACLPAREESSAELSELLNGFLATLGERDRRLFLGRYWYGLSVKEVAAEWGMTPNAASQNLAKTRERLRAYLSEGGYTV